jgi:hypothetical protein
MTLSQPTEPTQIPFAPAVAQLRPFAPTSAIRTIPPL